MKKQSWCIEGFNGTTRIFKTNVPLHHFSENQVEEVLKRLVCRHLTDDEIVSGSLNGKGKCNTLLRVHRSVQRPITVTCGDNPHYLAKVTEK
jgi:predicted TIM-barrel enzyme